MNTPHTKTLLAYAGAIALFCLFGAVSYATGDFVTPFVGLGLGMGFAKKDNDSQVYKTLALPGAGSTTVATAGIDLKNTARGDFLANVELLIEAPLLAVGELPNSETITYDVYHDTASDFGSESLLMDNVLTQTGAGGAGAAAAEKRVRFPVDVARYIRVKATSSSGSVDADAKEFSARLVF